MPTATIVIPTYNEEKNIAALLGDIARQYTKNFSLEKTIVICEGTDKTADIVRNFQGLDVHLIEHSERRGKAARINEIVTLCETDLMILLDADCRIKDDNTIDELVAPFVENPDVGLVCGDHTPFPPTVFVERCADIGYKSWDSIKKSLGPNAIAYQCNGKILALRKTLYSTLVIPDGIATDCFIFYDAVVRKFGVKFASKAGVHFKHPSTVRDYVRQMRRLLKDTSASFFSKAVVAKHSTAHFFLRLRALFPHAVQSPLETIGYVILQIISHISSLWYKRGPHWKIAKSTK